MGQGSPQGATNSALLEETIAEPAAVNSTSALLPTGSDSCGAIATVSWCFAREWSWRALRLVIWRTQSAYLGASFHEDPVTTFRGLDKGPVGLPGENDEALYDARPVSNH